jgi:pimeloyl-ACP methyl ester carboxylesterase
MPHKQLEHRFLAPARPPYQRPLLLLHRAWHGAWCWDVALADFARRGFEVHAISLRGHGASDTPRHFNLCGLDDYLADLRTALAAISPTPIVVGHSMGGFILQHLLAHEPLPGAVLLCSMPHTGAGRFLLHWARQHPQAALHTMATFNSRHLVGSALLAREAFFRSATPLADIERYAVQLGLESLRMACDMVLRRPCIVAGRTPTLVIAAQHDAVFTLREQRALVAAHAAAYLEIPKAAHDLMLDPAWPHVADAIEDFCRSLDSSEQNR